MKISVIIPTYKPEDYLWKCLDSLENQTFPKTDFEVILVLNGCKEPYYSKLIEYIKKSSIQYNFIQTDEAGVSNARNIGLDRFKGEYIAFIDDDDYVSPSYLQELYEKSSLDTIALCYPYAFKDGSIKQLPYYITAQYDVVYSKERQEYKKARKYFSGPCMKLISASCIQDRRFDLRFKNGEDSLFMFLISDKFKWVRFTSKNAIYYRRVRSFSATMRKRNFVKKLKNTLNLISEYVRIYCHKRHNYSTTFFLTRILGALKSCI